jgi:hypothetical protein
MQNQNPTPLAIFLKVSQNLEETILQQKDRNGS